jgi:hypothetical protein
MSGSDDLDRQLDHVARVHGAAVTALANATVLTDLQDAARGFGCDLALVTKNPTMFSPDEWQQIARAVRRAIDDFKQRLEQRAQELV